MRSAASATPCPVPDRRTQSRSPSQQVAETGQGFAGPLVHPGQRRLLIGLQHQGPGRWRNRQHLETDIQQDAERSEGADHESRDIVSGDVLHHLAAETQHLGAPGQHPRAQHQIARRAPVGSCRTGETAGDGAAEGGVGTVRGGEMGRLEGQHLTLLGQGRLDRVQGRPGARGDHQFLRLVVEDARVLGQPQRFTSRDSAQECLGAIPDQRQRRLARGGCRDTRLEFSRQIPAHARPRSALRWKSPSQRRRQPPTQPAR